MALEGFFRKLREKTIACRVPSKIALQYRRKMSLKRPPVQKRER